MMRYGDALAHQRVFNRARLRVGAVQHGRVMPSRLLPLRLADAAGDEVRFFDFVAGADVERSRSPPCWSVHSLLSLRLRFRLMTADAASRMICVER